MKYNILNSIGAYCVTPKRGQELYDLIHPLLIDGVEVELDFLGVKAYASPFFNYALGQLLDEISLTEFERLVKFSHLSAVGADVLARVMDTANRYYKEDLYREAVREVRDEELISC